MKKTLALDTRHSVTNPRPRPHYAGEIRKRSFISTVRPTVHTKPSRKRRFLKTLFRLEEFENAASFLRLGLPSTLIRLENRTFQKLSSKQFFVLTANILKTELFKNALHTRRIWKCRFISSVRPTVNTNPSRKRSFTKTLFKPKEFERSFIFTVRPTILTKH